MTIYHMARQHNWPEKHFNDLKVVEHVSGVNFGACYEMLVLL